MQHTTRGIRNHSRRITTVAAIGAGTLTLAGGMATAVSRADTQAPKAELANSPLAHMSEESDKAYCRRIVRRVPGALALLRNRKRTTLVRLQNTLPEMCRPHITDNTVTVFTSYWDKQDRRRKRLTVRASAGEGQTGTRKYGDTLLHIRKYRNLAPPRKIRGIRLHTNELTVYSGGGRIRCKSVHSRRGNVVRSTCPPSVGGYL